MAFNLTAGNPRAHRIRVYYFGTSRIYEGMPVCYDNSTTNWFGGSVTLGEPTASATTAEGSQNEGKYIRVENPNVDNVGLFAGVVANGGWCETTGPRPVDIYVPNGAVVPVRTDQNCLIDQTILAITSESQELGGPLATDSRSVAIARETVNRGTAGLVLAELCPDRFIYQDMGGTALSVDDADYTDHQVVNYINVKTLMAAEKGFTALKIESDVAAACGYPGIGIALNSTATVSATPADTGQLVGNKLAMKVTGGTPPGGMSIHGAEITLYESGATLTSTQYVTPLCVRTLLDAVAAPGNNGHVMMRFICDGVGDHPDAFFACNEIQDIAMTGGSLATATFGIPILVGASASTATKFYIMVSETLT